MLHECLAEQRHRYHNGMGPAGHAHLQVKRINLTQIYVTTIESIIQLLNKTDEGKLTDHNIHTIDAVPLL